MHLNDALACEPRITPVPCHHEQACGIAAEAYGRTGHPDSPGFGVALVTTGPGATNAITPVAGAWIDSVPLLVISGQVKRADRLAGRPLRQGGAQEVDIIPMVRGITKYAVTIDDPQSICQHFDAALRLMTTGRRGPVWLDVPLDVQAASIDVGQLAVAQYDQAPPSLPDPTTITRLIDRLARAERPLILAGHGVRLSGAARILREFAGQYGIPIATTWNALDLIPYDDPLAVGRPGTVAMRAANFAVQSCDFMLSIGARLDNIVTAYAPANFARGAEKFIVDVDPAELHKLDMPGASYLVSDAAAFLRHLLDQPVPQVADRNDWLRRIGSWKERYGPLVGQTLPESGRASHYQLVDVLSSVLPAENPVATGSSGLGVEVFYSTFRNKPGQRVFLTSGLGAMGYGLPAAIGACLGNGRKPTVLVESDGSLMLNIQELATLRALNLPIAVVLMNNGGYASIRNTQRNYFDSRFIATGPEAGLVFPDFVALAESFGIHAVRIEDVSRMRDLIEAALAGPRPCLIDVRLISDESLSPKVAAIPLPGGSMTSMPLEDMSPLLELQTLKDELDGDLDPRSLAARKRA